VAYATPLPKALGDYLKLMLLILNALLSLAVVFLMLVRMEPPSFDGLFVLLVILILLPYGIALKSSINYFRNVTTKPTWAVIGSIAGIIGLIAYIAEYTYEGTDGQGGLIFGVMPIYQLLGMAIFGFAATRSSAGVKQGKDS
jgi:hypothetical protein